MDDITKNLDKMKLGKQPTKKNVLTRFGLARAHPQGDREVPNQGDEIEEQLQQQQQQQQGAAVETVYEVVIPRVSTATLNMLSGMRTMQPQNVPYMAQVNYASADAEVPSSPPRPDRPPAGEELFVVSRGLLDSVSGGHSPPAVAAAQWRAINVHSEPGMLQRVADDVRSFLVHENRFERVAEFAWHVCFNEFSASTRCSSFRDALMPGLDVWTLNTADKDRLHGVFTHLLTMNTPTHHCFLLTIDTVLQYASTLTQQVLTDKQCGQETSCMLTLLYSMLSSVAVGTEGETALSLGIYAVESVRDFMPPEFGRRLCTLPVPLTRVYCLDDLSRITPSLRTPPTSPEALRKCALTDCFSLHRM